MPTEGDRSTMSEPYEIRLSSAAKADLRSMRPYDRQRVIDEIEQHLTFQPTLLSKSRIKQMEQPFWSQYRLRIGDFRAYYDVDSEARVVEVFRVLPKGTETTPEDAP
jgi:mRNA-degrading endonuclease RelE of RelBE toxin-antitoxin system